jgi:hypothetical protein
MAINLSTGFVRAAGYANKVRKVLFATARGKAEAKEIIRASAELNQKIFEKLQEMGVEKSDVIRIEIEFDISDEGKIEWNYDTLTIEVFKREEEEKLTRAMKEVEETEKALEGVISELADAMKEVEDAMIKLKEIVERLKQEHGNIES